VVIYLTIMKKALVFYNPKSGPQKEYQTIPDVRKALLEIGIEAEILRVQDYFYKKEFPQEKEYDLVIAIGGDGTIRLAANWILKNNPNTTLGVIPMGSGNLFADAIGIPLNFKKAVNRIADNKKIKVDVGLVNNDQYFILSFSFGHMAEVVGRTTVKEKRKLGYLAYLKEFVFRQIRLWDFDFEVDGKRLNIRGNNFFIFNAIKFMGFSPKKAYDFQDGILDSFITTNKTFLGWLISLIFLLLSKNPPQKIIFTTTGKEFKIYPKQSRTIKAQIDGDKIELDKATVKVVPGALKIIV
jgi:diacylglycerol kinase (ATP)